MRTIGSWIAAASLVAGSVFSAPAARAVMIGNIDGSADFPQGAASFADQVVSYSPGSLGLDPRASDPTAALGVPDMTLTPACATMLVSCPFVSLGTGGALVLKFVDNVLTGGGDSNPDLWIFETGPLVQGTFVDVSTDGTTWHSVGSVIGSVRGVDIDAFGFGPASMFRFVRLTDNGILDPGEEGESASVAGADIDAVGAISTTLTPVPLPAAGWLLLSGLVGFASIGRRRR